ncbi:MAG: ATP-binding protein [Gammaproteobacteria bacterium]|nr:ATP-binding protein [Gammaproteobacteria bacterium]
MDRLLKIARSGTPDTGVQFRKSAYGKDGIQSFLRDVLAIANTSVEGDRHIVVGVDFDNRGRKHAQTIDAEDFSGKPSYQALANEFIEPPVRIRYKPVSVDGKRVGVFEIGDCQDRPYMMRADFSESLRRGDAYKRVKNAPVKMGRRQLMELFELKFRDSVSAGDIEIGFPGEIIHKELALPTCDLSSVPSALASMKLEEMLDIRKQTRRSGSTTMVARLTHARLYGTEDPYVDRSPEDIIQELSQIRGKYRNHDSHFLFHEHAEQLQLVVINQGDEPIIDASIEIALPNHNSFFVADSPPRRQVDERFIARTPDEIASYPAVSLKDDAINITAKIGDIPVGEPVAVFASPLLLCIGSELSGRRFGMRYRLHGQNLRAAASGLLKLTFR